MAQASGSGDRCRAFEYSVRVLSCYLTPNPKVVEIGLL